MIRTLLTWWRWAIALDRKGLRRRLLNRKWINAIRKRIALRRLRTLQRGSPAWFTETEIKYGGIVAGIMPKTASRYDPRIADTDGDLQLLVKRIRPSGMRGGDRMSYNGYEQKYSQYITPYLQRQDRLTIVEIGILRGTGLAIWSDLFPESRIIGLDIDLTYMLDNLANLRHMGAFGKRDVELHEFDQFTSTSSYFTEILKGDRIDICIDDAAHTHEAILRTMASVMPHLSGSFVYFIEDNETVHNDIRVQYPGHAIERCGKLTIVSREG